MALKSGSYAIETYEPCQVGNKAALRKNFYVPEGRLDRAGCKGNVHGLGSKRGARIKRVKSVEFSRLFCYIGNFIRKIR